MKKKKIPQTQLSKGRVAKPIPRRRQDKLPT